MITKSMLERLRLQRARPMRTPAYTIGGSIQAEVDTRLHKRRESQLAQGERTLKAARQKFQTQQTFASRRGLAKAHFNHRKPTTEIMP